MNYYENIKDILIKNEIYKQVKDYSKRIFIEYPIELEPFKRNITFKRIK